jgi:pyruvate/2-oxoglutarate dehydrogenase complex dihydrolipoamide dehydrogenase (E3) component
MVDETKRKKVVAQKRGILKRENPTVTSPAEQKKAEGSVALPKEAKSKSKKKKTDDAKSRTTRKKDAPPFATGTVPRIAGPSYEQIRLRAYFISVHRRELGVPGDETADWVQAEAELRQEMASEQVSA